MKIYFKDCHRKRTALNKPVRVLKRMEEVELNIRRLSS